MPVRTIGNVSLTPELERFVDRTVASGRYRSASEVVRAALRLLELQERRQVQLRAARVAGSPMHGGENSAGFLVRLVDRLRKLTDPLRIVLVAEEALGWHLGVSRVGYGGADEAGRFFTVERNWTDGTVAPSVGVHDLAGFGPMIH